MEEIIYIAPNGLEVTEEELLAEYGDQFQDLVANGTFKKKNEVPNFLESESEESPSGFMSYIKRPPLPRSSYLQQDPNNPDMVTFKMPNTMRQRESRVRKGIVGDVDEALIEFDKKALAGSKRISSGLLRVPTYISEFLSSARGVFDEKYSEELNDLTLEEREERFAFTFAAERSNQLMKEAEEIEATMDQYENSISEDFGAFRVGQGLKRLVGEIGGAIPSLALVMSNPYGFAMLGSGTAADKSRQVQKAGGDLNFKTTSNALGTGIAEGAFELVTKGLGKRAFTALNGLPKDQAKMALENMAVEFAKGFGLEGASEALTLGSEEVLDALLLGNEENFQASFYEYLDTFIIGGAVGGPLRAVPVGFARVVQKKEKENLDKIIEDTKYKDVVDAFNKEKGNFTVEIDQLPIVDAPFASTAIEGTLKGQVARGEITQEQADAIQNNYDISVSTFNKVTDLNLNEDQKNEALKLIQRKTELEKLVEGKDKSIAKKEYNEIATIEKRLEEISESSEGVVTEGQAVVAEADKVVQEEGEVAPVTEVDQTVIEETTIDNIDDRADMLIESLKLEGVEPVKAASMRKKAFIDLIKTIKPKGKLAARNAKALINKVNSLNFKNPKSVARTLNQIMNTFETTALRDQKKQAVTLQGLIKTRMTNDKIETNQSTAAKEFALIDPKNVTNLEEYIKKAQEVADGLVTTKINKKGEPVIPTPFNYKNITDYSAKELQTLKEKKEEIDREAFEELTGVNPEELSLTEVRETITLSQEMDPETRDEFIGNKLASKEVSIKDGLKKAFNTFAAIAGNQIETGIDSFSGNQVDISESNKKLVKDFMEINPSKLSRADAARALDALVNFATNSNTGGMAAIVAKYKGSEVADASLKDGLKGKGLKGIFGRIPLIKNFGAFTGWVTKIASTPLAIETIFQSQRLGRKFMKDSGLQNFINAVAKSKKIQRDITKEYEKKFKVRTIKDKIKGKSKEKKGFDSASNITERGLLAFMRRTVASDISKQNAEFGRRKRLIKKSIKHLEFLGFDAKAKVYGEAYDKLLKGSTSVAQIESKSSKINIEAVEWMTNKWAEYYPQLKEINETIYNQSLENDINYTSDIISTLTDEQKIDFDSPLYESEEYINRGKIYDKQTGVLKPNQRIDAEALSENRYVNLNFDQGQLSAMRKAITNIETAYITQYMKGFFQSDSYSKMLPDSERRLIEKKVKTYVATQRGLNFSNAKAVKQAETFDKIASIGVARALSGAGQFIKQTAPIASTIITAGPINTAMALNAWMSSKKAREFIMNSGMPIANRGVDASTLLDGLDTQAEKLVITGEGRNIGSAGIKLLADISKGGLKIFLQKSDVITAQASFLAHYINQVNNLEDTGFLKGNTRFFEPGFDWSQHKLNQEAADYAQAKVDREQNVSDSALQGELFANRDIAVRIGLQLFMPFANFLLNRKTSIYSDVTALTSGQSSVEDKIESARSLVGYGAETAMFNALAYQLTLINYAISDDMIEDIGDDEIEPEEDKKRKENLLKGRLTSVAEDVFSPLPALNPLVTGKLNEFIEMTQESKDPFEFYETKRALVEDLGLARIFQEVYDDGKEYGKIVRTGELIYKDNQGNEQIYKLDDDDLALAQYSMGLQIFFMFGFPNELNRVAKQNFKFLKRKARKSRQKRRRRKAPAKLG